MRSARIVAQVRAILPEALGAHPVAAAYVYGSVARGTPIPTSDIDIALITQPLTLSPYERLTLELDIQADIEDAAREDTGVAPAHVELSRAETVERTPLPSIDVRIINEAPLLVRGHILQEAYWSTKATIKHGWTSRSPPFDATSTMPPSIGAFSTPCWITSVGREC